MLRKRPTPPPVLPFLLVAYALAGLLATDAYLPSLPILEGVFQVSAGDVQFTMTSYFAGVCIANLFYGPLSDGYGRRPILLLGGIGFLLATLLVALHVRRLKLPLPLLADLTAPALALAYAVGRVGCFLVGDDYGRPTASWVGVADARAPATRHEGAPPTTVEAIERTFGVQVDPALVERFGQVVPVHPTQLYEVGMSLLIFAFLWRIRVHRHRPGWLFMVWLALAGVERFVVEMFRVKDDRFFGPLTLAQVISIGLLVTGVVGALRLARGASARPATAAT